MPYRLPAEVVDDDYPVWLTTGPGREPVPVGYPDPAHRCAGRPVPRAALRDAPPTRRTIGVADGDLVTVTSRRGTITLPAHVVATIRPDTVFIPYHWPGDKAANQLTNRAVDPISKMPEFKVSAVRVEGRRPRRDHRPSATSTSAGRGNMSVDVRYGIDDSPMFVIDQSRCIGCEACVQACEECGTHRGSR
jgi:assimilatory nitrate reductase catalytic subunit